MGERSKSISKPAAKGSEPRLQRPGAGLPLVERLKARYWVGPVLSKRGKPSQSRAQYEKTARKLIARVAKVPADARKRKVLVPRLPGMEDSSRYWSVNGVLEHLLVFNRLVERVILSLAAGKPPREEFDVAKMKPGHGTHDPIADFMAIAPDLLRRVDERLRDPGMNFNNTVMKHPHPWYGPLTSKQWYWLVAQHQDLHYQQLKAVIAGLRGQG
jgi:hypothetical protein